MTQRPRSMVLHWAEQNGADEEAPDFGCLSAFRQMGHTLTHTPNPGEPTSQDARQQLLGSQPQLQVVARTGDAVANDSTHIKSQTLAISIEMQRRLPIGTLHTREFGPHHVDNNVCGDAMIDFEPDDEQKLMRDAVATLAKDRVRPATRLIETRRELPTDLRDALLEMGVTTMAIPASLGGLGLSACTQVLVEEELAWADAGVVFALPGPGNFGSVLLELGDEDQIARWLTPYVTEPTRRGAFAWSERAPHRERAGFCTTARRIDGGWILNGEKHFVRNAGLADDYVIAVHDEAVGVTRVFVVNSAAAGLTCGERDQTLGLDVGTFGSISLADVVVDSSAELLGQGDITVALLRAFSRISRSVAACAIGVSRAAWELSRDFADERKAFGKPIGHFQAIAFLLADRLMEVEGARGLLHRAAYYWDNQTPNRDSNTQVLAASAEAIAESLETAMKCGCDGVQIHGGAGFVRDYLVEKLMRDARQLGVSAPTSETSDQLFAALALRGSLDPALVLPMPEMQPIFT